jgi:hypothetical protein
MIETFGEQPQKRVKIVEEVGDYEEAYRDYKEQDKDADKVGA